MDLLVKPARVKHGKLASLLEPPKAEELRPAATKSEFLCRICECLPSRAFLASRCSPASFIATWHQAIVSESDTVASIIMLILWVFDAVRPPGELVFRPAIAQRLVWSTVLATARSNEARSTGQTGVCRRG